MNRLKDHYNNIVRQDLALRLHTKNSFNIPTIEKIVLNLGMKDVIKEKKRILIALLAMEAITGQRAITTRSKKMVAHLKIRKDMILGCKSTLRGNKAFLFLDRLNTSVLPRIKQYKGIHRKMVNTKGNLSLRIKNPLLFLELEEHYELFQDLPFLDITIVTTANNREDAIALLSSLQLPFA